MNESRPRETEHVIDSHLLFNLCVFFIIIWPLEFLQFVMGTSLFKTHFNFDSPDCFTIVNSLTKRLK